MSAFFGKIGEFVTSIAILVTSFLPGPIAEPRAAPVPAPGEAKIERKNDVEELSCTLTASKNPAVVGEKITLKWTTTGASDIQLFLATEKGGTQRSEKVASSGSKETTVSMLGLLPYKVIAKGPKGTKECSLTLRTYMTSSEASADPKKAIVENIKPKSTIRNTFFVEVKAGTTFETEDDSATVEVRTIRSSAIAGKSEIELRISEEGKVRTQVLSPYTFVDAGTYTLSIEEGMPLTIKAQPLQTFPPATKTGAPAAPKGSSADIARDLPFSTSPTPYLRGPAVGVTELDVRFLTRDLKMFAEYTVPVINGKWELQVPKPLPQGHYMIEFCCTSMPGGYYKNYISVTEKQPIISLRGAPGTNPTNLTQTELTVLEGEQFTISWDIEHADSCTLKDPAAWEEEPIALKGTRTFLAGKRYAGRTMNYDVHCTNGPLVPDHTPEAIETIKILVTPKMPTLPVNTDVYYQGVVDADDRRIRDLMVLQAILRLYFTERKQYPPSLSAEHLSRYLTVIPTDPATSQSYFYDQLTNGSAYEIGANLESNASPYFLTDADAAVSGGNLTSPSDADGCQGETGRYCLDYSSQRPLQ